LQVAALAGVPPKVISAARRFLQDLERRSAQAHGPKPQRELALDFAPEPTTHPAVEALKSIEPDAMTPKQALDALYKLKGMTRD